MINLSFHLSDHLDKNIKSSDTLRSKVLLYPMSPKQEIKLRWEASLEKIYWGLALTQNPLSKKQMAKILSDPQLKKMTDTQKEVVCYKKALDYIRNTWSGNNSIVTTKDILYLYDLACKDVFGTTTSYFKSKEQDVSQILKYVESGNGHPIIKAGLIQIEIMKLNPFENGTERIARLLSHLILAKYGYDLRGFLVLEDFYRADLITLRDASNSIERYKSATIWLEYFSLCVLNGTNKTLLSFEGSKQTNVISASYWKLNDRLQKITNLLENPNIKVTNKEVQKLFKVSQVTASRDLSKLLSLGILLAHGKGRSVFYTKI